MKNEKIEKKERKYHYTIGQIMPKIIHDGRINLTTLGSQKNRELAVWVSTNELWEEYANKFYSQYGLTIIANREDSHKFGGGLCRIQVKSNSAPFSWEAYNKKSKYPYEKRRVIEKVSKIQGASTDEWYASYKPIKKEDWIKIEEFDWDEQCWGPYKKKTDYKPSQEEFERFQPDINGWASWNCYKVHFHSIVESQINSVPYELFGIDRDKVLLCHGTVESPDTGTPRRGHAWLEYGDKVIDLSRGMGTKIDKKVIYEVGKVKDVVTYNLMEAAIMAALHGHMGPWNDEKNEPNESLR